ncbi:Carbonyl reductase [NADPH] 2 [Orchesella cincta]|uniref:Carbonyl reductase [NADPH] 2 n=1 Tax=Orchesella cincta TaxID=48709 RepID=A0A1D2MGC4_ORCCI|nr:Carbonyl reductase [NADPH] 2 [Orchesella cincta]
MAEINNFSGKKCLVTGAGRGIGRAVVAELCARGATVYAVSKNPENLKALKKEFPNVIPVCVDLSKPEEIGKALEPIETLDCLINNAGVIEPAEMLQVSAESFDRQFNVNVKAALIVSQIVAKKMIERGEGGSIVNISSINAQRPALGIGLYSCTKAALDMLTKSLAMELGHHKIRVNSVNPASVLTDMSSTESYDDEGKVKMQAHHDRLLSRTPTQTLWMPVGDVVNAVLFLASNATSQITGQCLGIDGGYLAH